MISFLITVLLLISPSLGEESSHILYSQDGLVFTTKEDGTGERYYVAIYKNKTSLKDVRKINLRTMMVSVDLKKKELHTTMVDEVLVWEEI